MRGSSRAAVVALGGLLVAGCPGSEEPGQAPTPTVAPPVRAQHLRSSVISDPKTFNPLMVTDNASAEIIGHVFDGLVRLNTISGEMEPSLAQRWVYDETGTVCTFHLRRDVRWHDGVPFTAADVVFTFDAIYDERVPNSLKHILTVDGKRIEAEAVDDHTVRLRLPRPFAPLINTIGFEILPAHVLGASLEAGTFAQQWGIDTPPAELVGTGPYRMVKYEPAQYVRYARNDDYWMRDEEDRALPYLEGQTILIVQNQDTAYLKFLAGETDVHSPRPEEVAELEARATELRLSVDEIGLDTGTQFVVFNRNPNYYQRNGRTDPRLEWFNDTPFLNAIAHAVDKEAMVNTCLYGLGRPAVAHISPENKRFTHAGLEDRAYDLDQARALLEAGGYRDRDGDGVREDAKGNRVSFTLHTNSGNQVREKICSILKEDWTKLGLEVHYRPIEFTALVEKLDTSFEWDAVLIGFTGGLEPHNGANLLRSNGNLHLWYPNQQEPATAWEAEIDRLLEAGSRELDPDARQRIYREIQEILHEELPMIQTVRALRHTAYTNALQNYRRTVWGPYRPERLVFAE